MACHCQLGAVCHCQPGAQMPCTPCSARLIRAALRLRSVFDSWVPQYFNLTALRLCVQHCGSGSSIETCPSTCRPASKSWRKPGQSRAHVGTAAHDNQVTLDVFARLPMHEKAGCSCSWFSCLCVMLNGTAGQQYQWLSLLWPSDATCFCRASDSSDGLLPFLKRIGSFPKFLNVHKFESFFSEVGWVRAADTARDECGHKDVKALNKQSCRLSEAGQRMPVSFFPALCHYALPTCQPAVHGCRAASWPTLETAIL